MASCVRHAVSSDMHGGTASFVAMLDAAGRTAAGEMLPLVGAALTDRVWTAFCLASLVRQSGCGRRVGTVGSWMSTEAAASSFSTPAVPSTAPQLLASPLWFADQDVGAGSVQLCRGCPRELRRLRLPHPPCRPQRRLPLQLCRCCHKILVTHTLLISQSQFSRSLRPIFVPCKKEY